MTSDQKIDKLIDKFDGLVSSVNELVIEMRLARNDHETLRRDFDKHETQSNERIERIEGNYISKAVVYSAFVIIVMFFGLLFGAIELYFSSNNKAQATPMHASISKVEPIPFEQKKEVVI